MRRIGRKEFIILWPALGAFVVLWLWKRSVDRESMIRQRKQRVYFKDGGGPVSLEQEVIYIQENDVHKAFSARCTHLGCKLNLFPDGRVVCPCHGSEFTANGKVIKGPAKKNLEELTVFYDPQQKLYYTEILYDE